jgi:hypothetical protein
MVMILFNNLTGPLSPLGSVEERDDVPVPAIVEMIPDEETARTLWALISTMKRVPTEFCHTPTGPLIVAKVAIPPSPEEDRSPVPATVSTRYEGGIIEGRFERRYSFLALFPLNSVVKMFPAVFPQTP